MAGGRGGGRTESRRVKTARGRKSGSTRWLHRQLNDPYVQEAKRAGYRSRAAFKLVQIDDKFGILKGARRVVDLGAAPGGWCQVVAAAQQAKGGTVVGVDLQEIDPIGGVTLVQLDFLAGEAPGQIRAALGGAPAGRGADLVLSDLAAASTGHQSTDHLRTLELAETAAVFAFEMLRPGGGFVVKVLQGADEPGLFKLLEKRFARVRRFKPAASRSDSTELYLVALDFRGPLEV